jgi:hypothetical protein
MEKVPMMNFFRTPVLRVSLALMLLSSFLGATVSAAPTANLSDGRTSVTLSNDFFTALNTLGVAAGTIGAGTIRGGVASFPITGGALDLGTAKGEINHTGGLSLSKGNVRVELSSFNVDTLGSAPVLTGLVTANGTLLGRVPLFKLTLPQLTLPLQTGAFNTLFIPGVRVGLSPEAAAALNSVFGVTAFAADFNIGTASVFAQAFPNRRRLFLPDLYINGIELDDDGKSDQ